MNEVIPATENPIQVNRAICLTEIFSKNMRAFLFGKTIQLNTQDNQKVGVEIRQDSVIIGEKEISLKNSDIGGNEDSSLKVGDISAIGKELNKQGVEFVPKTFKVKVSEVLA